MPLTSLELSPHEFTRISRGSERVQAHRNAFASAERIWLAVCSTRLVCAWAWLPPGEVFYREARYAIPLLVISLVMFA